ncbi:uncharacterized protein VTP21DRAFT_11618 [Calcarisporiella thermophila]|uniref:uncharacterized protein n=1 Tax=Calcarisporiella thermophila TaxID=911321 RepID=UPI0037442CF6
MSSYEFSGEIKQVSKLLETLSINDTKDKRSPHLSVKTGCPPPSKTSENSSALNTKPLPPLPARRTKNAGQAGQSNQHRRLQDASDGSPRHNAQDDSRISNVSRRRSAPSIVKDMLSGLTSLIKGRVSSKVKTSATGSSWTPLNRPHSTQSLPQTALPLSTPGLCPPNSGYESQTQTNVQPIFPATIPIQQQKPSLLQIPAPFLTGTNETQYSSALHSPSSTQVLQHLPPLSSTPSTASSVSTSKHSADSINQCHGINKNGRRCGRRLKLNEDGQPVSGTWFCHQHRDQTRISTMLDVGGMMRVRAEGNTTSVVMRRNCC